MTDETPPGSFNNELRGGRRYEAAVMLKYPFLAFSERRTKELRFPDASGKITLVVETDRAKGMAFVSDVNVLIWVISELHERIKVRHEPRRDIVLSIARSKLLRYIGKEPGGSQHEDLIQTLERLRATRVTTNLPFETTGGEVCSFSLLEGCDEDKADPTDPVWTIKPPEWLIDVIGQKNSTVPINLDSMKLHGLRRCVYRYALATVGDSTSHQVHLDPARAADRFGATGKGAVPMMRFRLKKLVEALEYAEAQRFEPENERQPIIPDYTVTSAKDGITIQRVGTVFV